MLFFSFRCTVVSQFYESQVYDDYVIKGNAAVLKCNIPSFVSDHVEIIEWIDSNGGHYNRDENNSGKWKKIHNAFLSSDHNVLMAIELLRRRISHLSSICTLSFDGAFVVDGATLKPLTHLWTQFAYINRQFVLGSIEATFLWFLNHSQSFPNQFSFLDKFHTHFFIHTHNSFDKSVYLFSRSLFLSLLLVSIDGCSGAAKLFG